MGELGVRAVRAACRACFGMMGEGFAKCRGRQGGHTCSTLPRRVVLAGLEKVIKLAHNLRRYHAHSRGSTVACGHRSFRKDPLFYVTYVKEIHVLLRSSR